MAPKGNFQRKGKFYDSCLDLRLQLEEQEDRSFKNEHFNTISNGYVPLVDLYLRAKLTRYLGSIPGHNTHCLPRY